MQRAEFDPGNSEGETSFLQSVFRCSSGGTFDDDGAAAAYLLEVPFKAPEIRGLQAIFIADMEVADGGACVIGANDLLCNIHLSGEFLPLFFSRIGRHTNNQFVH